MFKDRGIPTTEITVGGLTFKKDNGGIQVSSSHVDLSSEREPLRFAVTLEKVPTQIVEGTNIWGVIIDRDSPRLQSMMEEAAALKNIQDREKPRKILEILRTRVHFAYNDVIEELSGTNSGLAKWVAENIGLDSSSARELTLSNAVDSGYGVCRHLSVAMLVLAKAAGIEGALLTNGPSWGLHGDEGPIRNVIRKDNGQPLFKMGKVGDPMGGHLWVELITSEGEWIPVDPSTQLVGDTLEGMEIFREANYRAAVGLSLETSVYPPSISHLGFRDLEPFPGESRHTGILEINSQPKQKPRNISLDDKDHWPKPTSYQGPLNFIISSQTTTRGLTVEVVDVKAT